MQNIFVAWLIKYQKKKKKKIFFRKEISSQKDNHAFNMDKRKLFIWNFDFIIFLEMLSKKVAVCITGGYKTT